MAAAAAELLGGGAPAKASGGAASEAAPSSPWETLGPGVRVDTFVQDGSVIPPHYDSLIAKVIVRDTTRDACIERALRVLRELEVSGVPTTRDVAIDILGSVEFRSGDYSTSFLEEAALPALTGV